MLNSSMSLMPRHLATDVNWEIHIKVALKRATCYNVYKTTAKYLFWDYM